jgi:TRAP-type uncharacterized transport system fused permease subunit
MSSPAAPAAPPPAGQADAVDRLIEQFDPESNFRRLVGLSAGFVTVVAVGLSGWHYYTAGFGLHNEIAHRAIHLAVVLGLCFLVFPRQKRFGGHWEWTVSLFLVAFYLLMGLGLLDSLSDAVPAVAKLVFIAVLLYFTYANLLQVSENWIRREQIPVMLGMWWVHALVLVLMVFLMWRQRRV